MKVSQFTNLYLDRDKVKQAAVILREKDSSYGSDETKPDVSVYEAAIGRWLEYSIESMLDDAEWWAYGPYSHLTTEFEHAMEWATKPAADFPVANPANGRDAEGGAAE